MLLLKRDSVRRKNEVSKMEVKMKAILAEAARTHVRIERGGQGGNYTFPKLGLTAVSIDQGQISSTIPWMIHGIEAEISGDIADFVSSFELRATGLIDCDVGHYVLRNRSNQIIAEAKVEEWVINKRECYIHGGRREDVVKLFEQIRSGETAPESAGGRRGLIRSLREELAEAVRHADALQEASDKLVQVSSARIRELEAENVELKKVKKLTPWQFFWRAFFGTNDPQVA